MLYRFAHESDGANPSRLSRRQTGRALRHNRFQAVRHGFGTAFKLTPPADVRTPLAHAARRLAVIHDFKGGDDGAIPLAGLIFDAQGRALRHDGRRWRRGLFGGSGCGTVFKLTPPAEGETAWTETVLDRFKVGADGQEPNGGLVAGKEGELYGATAQGGGGDCYGSSCGTILS